MYGSEVGGRRKTLLYFAAFGFLTAVVLLQAVSARPILGWMLTESLRAPAARWAHFVFDQLADVEPRGSIRRDQLAGAHLSGGLGAGLATGSLLQIDVYNNACGCGVSIGPGWETGPNGAALTRISDALSQLFEGRLARGNILTLGAPSLAPAPEPLAIEPGGAPLTGLVASPDPMLQATIGTAAFARVLDGTGTTTVRVALDLQQIAFQHKLLLWLASVIVTGLSATFTLFGLRHMLDSHEAVRLSEEQARYLAEHDTLTDLFNRFGFGRRAEVLLSQCREQDRHACLIQVDLDRLKEINDQYGHPVGDRLLIAAAEAIRGALPPSAIAARLGGDEFAILLDESQLTSDFEAIVAALPDRVSESRADHAISLTVSVGHARFPEDGATMLALMKAADLALAESKNSPDKRIHAFDRSMSEALAQRLWEIDGILEASDNGGLHPYYQPIVDAKTGRLVAVESLTRWRHARFGLLSPAHFENALTDPTASVAITRFMLERVSFDLSCWRRAGYDFRAGLNVSEADLRRSDFVSSVKSTLLRHDLPPEALVIEITETAINGADMDHVIPVLAEIRDLGMLIALDDFGTGSSSVKILKQVPCTTIKIDKSFVRNILQDRNDQSIVEALVKLAHDMDLRVIAEGVETEDQADFLRTIGVDLLQGYHFGHPVPVEKLLATCATPSAPLLPSPKGSAS